MTVSAEKRAESSAAWLAMCADLKRRHQECGEGFLDGELRCESGETCLRSLIRGELLDNLAACAKQKACSPACDSTSAASAKLSTSSGARALEEACAQRAADCPGSACARFKANDERVRTMADGLLGKMLTCAKADNSCEELDVCFRRPFDSALAACVQTAAASGSAGASEPATVATPVQRDPNVAAHGGAAERTDCPAKGQPPHLSPMATRTCGRSKPRDRAALIAELRDAEVATAAAKAGSSEHEAAVRSVIALGLEAECNIVAACRAGKKDLLPHDLTLAQAQRIVSGNCELLRIAHPRARPCR